MKKHQKLSLNKQTVTLLERTTLIHILGGADTDDCIGDKQETIDVSCDPEETRGDICSSYTNFCSVLDACGGDPADGGEEDNDSN